VKQRKHKGLWLYWCAVDGYSTARCSCSSEAVWFPNWRTAEKADDERRAGGGG
jgi:hypothetical protein